MCGVCKTTRQRNKHTKAEGFKKKKKTIDKPRRIAAPLPASSYHPKETKKGRQRTRRKGDTHRLGAYVVDAVGVALTLGGDIARGQAQAIALIADVRHAGDRVQVHAKVSIARIRLVALPLGDGKHDEGK